MARACATCEWFEADELDRLTALFGSKIGMAPQYPEAGGTCRRHPPVPVLLPDATDWYWPEVDSDDWCGEYQPRHPAAEHP